MNDASNRSTGSPPSRVPPLKYIQFHPSNRCNVDCLFCWVHHHTPSFPDIPDEVFLDLLGESLEMGVHRVTISGGGEPLVRPALVERMITTVKAFPGGEKVDGVLITNGTVIQESLAETAVRLGWNTIHVSVQGSTPSVDTSLRSREGALEKTIEGIERINRWKERLGVAAPKIMFVVILTRRNAHDLLNMTRLADSLHVSEVSFRLVNEGDDDGSGGFLTVRPEQVPEMLALLEASKVYCRSRRMNIKVEFDANTLAEKHGVAPIPEVPDREPREGEDDPWPPPVQTEARGETALPAASRAPAPAPCEDRPVRDEPDRGPAPTRPAGGEDKPIFCVLPFCEMVVFANGTTNPCCNFFDTQLGMAWGEGDDLVVSALDLGIRGAWTSPEFDELRRRMIDHAVPARCRACSPDLHHYVSEVLPWYEEGR